MIIHDSAQQITTRFIKSYPELKTILPAARQIINSVKGHVYEYQAACLYALASEYRSMSADILEIGTLVGYSTYFLASAAPLARIVTLNPNVNEARLAWESLARFPNVQVSECKSWDLLEHYDGPQLDMIFVDGDHNRIARDMPWWNQLKPGGLMVWHDYAPEGTPRPCLPIYLTLNAWREKLGRRFDVEVIDSDNVGLVGFYRREGETWGE